jgi:site-specific recombinase XerD
MEYAASERNLSPNTRESYRDMLVLLLPFAASSKSTSVDKLAVTDLSADTVRAFLAHLENERRCSTATRNQRLASIHALARFIGAHSPQHVEWCAQIRMVPIKKGVANSITYLEKPEIDALLALRASRGRYGGPLCVGPEDSIVHRHAVEYSTYPRGPRSGPGCSVLGADEDRGVRP